MPGVDGLRMIESDSEARRRERREWTADLLDLEAGRIGVPVLDREAILTLLGAEPKLRIAIIGASPSPVRPSHGVLVDLQGLGYDVVPVNPTADEVAGLRCYPTLAEAVDVGARVLWLQLGIASREAGRIAHEAGLAVVMNRCLAVEAMRL